jgi:Uma2 family endonuclease
MQIEVQRKRFTVDEYHRMGEIGVLSDDDFVELIEGEIVMMPPIGNRHLGCVNAASTLLTIALAGRAVVSGQNPLQLSGLSEPQPDIVILKPRKDFYRSKRPEATDSLLVIEVAETSIKYDRDVKLGLYARAGVPEVWIENLEDNLLLVYRNVSEAGYKTQLSLPRSATVSPQTFPDVTFQVEELLG